LDKSALDVCGARGFDEPDAAQAVCGFGSKDLVEDVGAGFSFTISGWQRGVSRDSQVCKWVGMFTVFVAAVAPRSTMLHHRRLRLVV
jgi:hypothetical protein